jgi:F-type H+-transporting ATPase subunit alpha
LAQYRELEAFSAFGSDLDKASKAQLERGARLVELLKQPQYSPFSVAEEVVSVWAGTTGRLDDIPIAEIRRFEGEFLQDLKHNHQQILDTIGTTGKLDDDTAAALEAAIDHFKAGFLAKDNHIRVNEPPAEPLAEGAEDHETVTRHRHAAPEVEKK